MPDDREERDLLIRISVLLENLTGQVNGLGERFTRLETQVQDVNQRGLLQQTAIERLGERVKEVEADVLAINANGTEGALKRIEELERARLVWNTQFKTFIVISTPVYGLAIAQIGKWVSTLLFGN